MEPLPWNEYQVSRLMSLYGDGMRLADIADLLGTTKGAVASKTRRMRLKRPLDWKKGRRIQRKHAPKHMSPADVAGQDTDIKLAFIREDFRFQEAMRAAGYRNFTDKRPGTQNPKLVIGTHLPRSGSGSSAAMTAEWGAR